MTSREQLERAIGHLGHIIGLVTDKEQHIEIESQLYVLRERLRTLRDNYEQTNN